eukprot:GHVS01079639.1.p1 GENE.GHVS01079639.1~~GHVS01079639.1.p1  ORF type:complete len:811 (-),score=136.52 GHVS01079639.1:112-2472(-)
MKAPSPFTLLFIISRWICNYSLLAGAVNNDVQHFSTNLAAPHTSPFTPPPLSIPPSAPRASIAPLPPPSPPRAHARVDPPPPRETSKPLLPSRSPFLLSRANKLQENQRCEAVAASFTQVFALFTAPWCSNCKAFFKHFHQAAHSFHARLADVAGDQQPDGSMSTSQQYIRNIKLQFVWVDCTISEALCSTLPIEGFPDIRLLQREDSSPISSSLSSPDACINLFSSSTSASLPFTTKPYTGDRDSAHEIVNWLEKRLHPVSSSVSSPDELDRFLQLHPIVAIALISKDMQIEERRKLLEAFKDTSRHADSAIFAHILAPAAYRHFLNLVEKTSSSSIRNSRALSPFRIFISKPFDERFVEYLGDPLEVADVYSFINRHRLPYVVPISDAMSAAAALGSSRFVLLLVATTAQLEREPGYLAALRNLFVRRGLSPSAKEEEEEQADGERWDGLDMVRGAVVATDGGKLQERLISYIGVVRADGGDGLCAGEGNEECVRSEDGMGIMYYIKDEGEGCLTGNGVCGDTETRVHSLPVVVAMEYPMVEGKRKKFICRDCLRAQQACLNSRGERCMVDTGGGNMATNLARFAKRVVEGEEAETWMTESLPLSQKGPVYRLVGASFDGVVMESRKDIIVLFYLSACRHSHAAVEAFNQLAAEMVHEEELVFAAMEGSTRNEVAAVDLWGGQLLRATGGKCAQGQKCGGIEADSPKLSVGRYPTIVLYRKNKKGNGKEWMLYEGMPTDVEQLKFFLKAALAGATVRMESENHTAARDEQSIDASKAYAPSDEL